ncbi:BTB/POZ domain-containing protein 2 [Suricata suricatta]|uniref:BTB/POZ domain-containing protein 2 n=1 Tax=Suricata suricatta TaxID=37032 RepID=UPI001155CE07|nr:BTB/POZ domain-containing protein 2 [Suricata suricatta]
MVTARLCIKRGALDGPLGCTPGRGAERAAEEPGAAALLREPVYNWQATKPTLKERFAFLFNNEVLCDVHFLVGKGLGAQRIPAHRFVLAVGSAVFDAMFNGGMATTSTEIELPDVEPAAFLALLKCLSEWPEAGPHAGAGAPRSQQQHPERRTRAGSPVAHSTRCPSTHRDVTRPQEGGASHHLPRVDGPRGHCGDKSDTGGHRPLMGSPEAPRPQRQRVDGGSQGVGSVSWGQSLSLGTWKVLETEGRGCTAVSVLDATEMYVRVLTAGVCPETLGDLTGLPLQARLFDEPQLASLCLENIDKNTADAITAEGFTDIDLDTLVAVLERDTLGIREVRLFNAVVRWAEAECQRQQLQATPDNKRAVLGQALALIRFPLMTIEEFAAGPAQSGILVDREVVSLFLHFTVNPKPRVEFIDRPRCCLRGKECSINRFQQVESRWGYSGTSDRIRFSVNKRIFVVGFGLYGSIHGPTDYQVNIQIIHTDSNTVLGQNDTGFSCDGSASTFRVMFKEPVEMLPNVNYTACATLKGPDSHYGTKGLRKVTHESPTTGAKTCFTFCYAAGNNNGTSVEDGQIPEVIFYT